MRTIMPDNMIREIPSSLTHRYPVITLPQVAECFDCDYRTARETVYRLIGKGLLKWRMVFAFPLLSLQAPLYSWRPGDPEPHFGSISHQARERWSEELTEFKVFTATDKTAAMFGGKPSGVLNPLQAGHELHVTAMYLWLKKNRPDEAKRFYRGDLMSHRFSGQGRVPDALVTDTQGKIMKAYDFLGNYPCYRIKSFFDWCRGRGWAHEGW